MALLQHGKTTVMSLLLDGSLVPFYSFITMRPPYIYEEFRWTNEYSSLFDANFPENSKYVFDNSPWFFNNEFKAFLNFSNTKITKKITCKINYINWQHIFVYIYCRCQQVFPNTWKIWYECSCREWTSVRSRCQHCEPNWSMIVWKLLW